MANEQQNVLKAKKTVAISIEEYETFKAENARLNQQIQWFYWRHTFFWEGAHLWRVWTHDTGDRQGSSQNAADRPCAGSYSPLKYPRKSRCSVNRMFVVLIWVRRQKPAVAIVRWKQKHPQLLNRWITPISNMMKSASHKAKIDCYVGGF